MKGFTISLLLLSFLVTSSASTLRVTVGNMGCRTRQLTVQRCWMSLRGIDGVIIVPRKPSDPANRRVFILTSNGTSPEEADLKRALGRRARRYPILAVDPLP